MIKSVLKGLLPERLKNYIKIKSGAPDQRDSLLRIKNLGFSPSVILDIGAYEGTWCKFIKEIFPRASILMLEGQNSKSPILEKVSYTYKNISYKIALLGAETKEVEFNIYETASSVLKEENETGAETEKRTLVTLDDVLKGSNFMQPDFIKIDTQGYELEILKGGLSCLASAQGVLLEVSMLDIYKDSPLVYDIILFMKNHGFVLYDICSLMRRPYDKALFQSDFLFVKDNSPLRTSKRWI